KEAPLFHVENHRVELRHLEHESLIRGEKHGQKSHALEGRVPDRPPDGLVGMRQEADRLGWVRALRLLGERPEAAFDRVLGEALPEPSRILLPTPPCRRSPRAPPRGPPCTTTPKRQRLVWEAYL